MKFGEQWGLWRSEDFTWQKPGTRLEGKLKEGTELASLPVCGVWKWTNNMIFEAAPWSFNEAWRRLCHDHDEIRRFMEVDADVEDENWMERRWKAPPEGKANLRVDGSYRVGDDCMGS